MCELGQVPSSLNASISLPHPASVQTVDHDRVCVDTVFSMPGTLLKWGTVSCALTRLISVRTPGPVLSALSAACCHLAAYSHTGRLFSFLWKSLKCPVTRLFCFQSVPLALYFPSLTLLTTFF